MGLFLFGLVIFFIGFTLFFLAVSIREVPADPPHVALMTRFGSPIKQVKRSGNRLFPFYAFGFYGAIPIGITKVTESISQTVRAGADAAQINVEITVTWTPDEENALEYVLSGKAEGVNKMLAGQVSESLRKWAKNNEKDWRTILQADDEVNNYLIRKISGIAIKDKSDEARGLVEKIDNGSANQPIQSMGIRLQRLHLAKINISGRLGEVADLPAVEAKIMSAENVRMAGFVERVDQLVALNIPRETAVELLQLERGYAQRKINDIRGLSADQVAMAQKLVAGQSNS